MRAVGGTMHFKQEWREMLAKATTFFFFFFSSGVKMKLGELLRRRGYKL
jgi:hypothetical protein